MSRISLVIIALLFLSSSSSEAATLGLAWDPSQDGVTTGYVIRYGTASGSYSQVLDVGNATSYSITTLSDGVRYYFVVQGYNAAGQFGSYSEEISGVTGGAATGVPGPPSNLAGSVSGDQVSLSWQAPGGSVTGYRIEVGTGPGLINVTTINTGPVTTYTGGGLTTGTYYIRVRTVNSSGTSAPSNEVVVNVGSSSGGGGGSGGAPTNLVGSVSGSSTVALSWQAGGTVTGYRVEVGRGPGQTNVVVLDTGAATNYSVSGVTEGVYYVRVRGWYGSALSGPSNEVVVTVGSGGGGGGSAGAPTGLVASVRASSIVDLSWQAPGAVSGYRIEVGRGPGQTNVVLADIAPTTSYSIGGVTEGVYYVRVRSWSGSTLSAPSNEVVVTVGSGGGGGGGSLSAPTNLAATVRNSSTVDLSWQGASGASGYRIEVGRGPGQTNVAVFDMGTATTISVNGVTEGVYYVRVRALSSGGVSAPSNEVIVTVGGTGGSGSSGPSNLSASVRDNGWVDLTWSAPSGSVGGYRLLVGRSPGQLNVLSVFTDRTTYTISGLTDGTYYARVHAITNEVWSNGSNDVAFTVGNPPTLAAPSELSATMRDGDNRVIDLTWSPGDPAATAYRVEIGTSPSMIDVSSFTTGVTTNFAVGQLPARRYYIRVRAINSDGLSDHTEEVVIAGSGESDAPRRLAGIVENDGGVRLAWDEPQDGSRVLGYRIEVGAGPGRSDLAVIPTSERSLTSGPVPAGTYFVRVRAITDRGPGSASNEIAIHTGAAAQCTAPPALPRLSATAVGSRVALSWAPGAGPRPTGYLLDVGTSPGRRDIATIPFGAEVTTVASDVPDGSYALRLIAVNACGASAAAAEASVTVGGPALTLPDAPINLTQRVNGRQVTLNWSPVTTGGEVTSYAIDVLSPTGQVLMTLDTGNTSTTFTHGNAPPGEYRVRVRAVNARGSSVSSDAVLVSVQ